MRNEGQRIASERVSTGMEAFKTSGAGWRTSPAYPLDSGQEQVLTKEREGDAATSSQAAISAPTRWCGKTSLCEKCAYYSLSPPQSKAEPCPAQATAAAAAQGPRWSVTQENLGIGALVFKVGAGRRVTSTEPAASIKSLLPNPAHAHALFKTFTAVTGLFLSAHAEGPAPAGTMGVHGGVLHQPLIILKPSDMSEQARSRQFEG